MTGGVRKVEGKAEGSQRRCVGWEGSTGENSRNKHRVREQPEGGRCEGCVSDGGCGGGGVCVCVCMWGVGGWGWGC